MFFFSALKFFAGSGTGPIIQDPDPQHFYAMPNLFELLGYSIPALLGLPYMIGLSKLLDLSLVHTVLLVYTD